AVGPCPSVLRAAMVGALGSFAWLAARQRDRWPFLLLAALILLAWNTATLFDAGFQLSFVAVAAIFTLVPRLLDVLEGYPLPEKLAQVVAVSTVCGLATAPVLWLQFHAVPLLTVPANALAEPAMPPLLALALLAALVDPIAPSVATWLAWLAGWCAAYIAACNALGLFGGEQRLVIIEDVDEWRAADAKTVAEYLKDPAPQTVLALVAAEVKKESALAKACAKAGDLLLYDAPRKRDLPAWI